MRILVTGGTGVLGRAAIPLLRSAGHTVVAPARGGVDLLDPRALAVALEEVDAILHLATRIPPPDRYAEPAAWIENDVLRRDVSRALVDAALAAAVATYIQPTVTFVYPPDGPADEDTRVVDVAEPLRSALDAEAQAERFAQAGRRGVALRLGLLDGPGTGNDEPNRAFGASLAAADAGHALVAALVIASGVYNVCRDDERVSNERFKRASGWRPSR